MEHIRFNETGTGVIIIDQSLLPNEEKYIELTEPEAMCEAIRKLRVRGAPAIGIFAGYALAALAKQQASGSFEHRDSLAHDDSFEHRDSLAHDCSFEHDDSFLHKDSDLRRIDFVRKLEEQAEYLKSSRPTAVNLAWAADRVVKAAENAKAEAADEIAEVVCREALAIRQEDIAMCTEISRLGMEEIRRIDIGAGHSDEYMGGSNECPGGRKHEAFGILTHCNAGPLATSEYGTALGPIIMGHEQGMNLRVFADETRPLLQGARLTTYELHKRGIDVTLICDNMASMVMKKGWVQAVFVGSDRIAANGDAANKIGTSGVAVLAKHYGIPFYVLAPSSTIDPACPTGADIPIEERDPEEIREKFYEKPMAPEGIKCYNPSFDVTDSRLIAGIITEKGIFRYPYSFVEK